jgi:hypothetical protein
LPDGRFDAGLVDFFFAGLDPDFDFLLLGVWGCGCEEDFWPWPLAAGAGVVDE